MKAEDADRTAFGPGTPLGAVIGRDAYAKLRKGFGYELVGDLLDHFPNRYLEVGELTAIATLPLGEDVTIVAEVDTITQRRMHTRRGMLVEVVVKDAFGPEQAHLRMTFFNGYQALKDLHAGTVAMFSGRVTRYREHLELTHPQYAVLESAADAEPRPIPVYPSTGKLANDAIRKSVLLALSGVDEAGWPDPVPPELLRRRRLLGRAAAYRAIHHPHQLRDAHRALRRFRYDEALLLQLAIAQRRAHRRGQPAVPRPAASGGLLERFDAALPFRLTPGQRATGEEIAADLAGTHPMNRLLQGDVGSGKTLVALRAMLQVIDAGGQAALLAPTEVLAAQHHQSITRALGPLAAAGMLGGDEGGTRVDLLTGSMSAARRREVLLRVASGETGIVVGTHALLSEHLQFAELGLVVVDEQHRFGVEQRDALRAKAGATPHMLVMTATPIPRTVAMTVFGDLEVSILEGLPAGRAPINTHVVPLAKPKYRTRLFELMREEVARGHQVYVVVPRITEASGEDDGGSAAGAASAAGTGGAEAAGSGAAAAKVPRDTVEAMMARLRAMPLMEGVRVGELHGRLATEDKARTMADFEAGRIDILVSTTVIEVGVDVHNATLMAVVDADAFGISQLHQLRGRVGRGGLHGTCLLATWLEEGHPSRARLDAVAATRDGFALAEEDLKQRREGDILGSSQSGRKSTLKVLRVIQDADLIAAAREDAEAIVDGPGGLEAHPALARAVRDWVDEDMQAFLERG
ncbi:ATP-dependent DNA helicase RecG [Zafaria cholistanensis]|uniref:Probable DNA 3'-5' helicase RecG n=1 Tax=Zafaria cholistanensis TaxID=1682741 RepID=A0A5A7NQ54_9MICC|nr:ATP-dependent DNA helicase RecG [Zafaria cholistanensis]GER21911.1 ATP-dependent DNA helicase RecG [Zafaria cholistanensis]